MISMVTTFLDLSHFWRTQNILDWYRCKKLMEYHACITTFYCKVFHASGFLGIQNFQEVFSDPTSAMALERFCWQKTLNQYIFCEIKIFPDFLPVLEKSFTILLWNPGINEAFYSDSQSSFRVFMTTLSKGVKSNKLEEKRLLLTAEIANREEASLKVAWCTEHFRL